MKSGETFTREFALDRAKLNEKSRSIELSFSSEARIERSFGGEILSHEPGAIDFSRLNAGGPLLWGHDADQLIGKVERAWIDGGKARAVVRFGNSNRAKEVLQDVQDGILESVSVGYRIDKLVRDESDKELYRAVRWTPLEVSFVSIPADASVGVGRSAQITEKNYSMKESHLEIAAIADRLAGRIPEIRELADRAVLENQSVETFRARALELMPEAQPITRPHLSDVKPKDWQRYSISRALHTMASGRPLDGLEGELSREMEKRAGTAAEGFFVPDEALAFRSHVAGTGTLGGNLVETSNLGDQFIELLRNRAQCINLGARVLNLTNPVTIPRQSGAGTTNWIGETVASTLTSMNFTQLTLTPHAVGAFQQYSKMLLITGNPSVDALIRNDLLEGIALAIDRAALHGAGGAEPTGIANTTGVSTVALAASGLALGNATAYPAMVSLESMISASNADGGALGFMIRAGHRGALRTAQRFTGTDSPVYKDGKILDYKAAVTQQIAANLTTGTATTICSAIFFGDWNQLLVSHFGATDLVVDPYTLAVNGVVRVVARKFADIGVRHPESFAILGGILTT